MVGVKLFGIKENQWMISDTLYDGTVGIYLVFHLCEWIYHDRKYHKIFEVLDNRFVEVLSFVIEEDFMSLFRFYIRWYFI